MNEVRNKTIVAAIEQGHGLLLTLSVPSGLALALTWLDMGTRQALRVFFLTLAFAQLFHVFNRRGPGSKLLANQVTRDAFICSALGLCAGLLFLAAYLPGLAAVPKVSAPGLGGWLLVFGMSAVAWATGQTVLAVRSAPAPRRE